MALAKGPQPEQDDIVKEILEMIEKDKLQQAWEQAFHPF
jgi:hypothetical protein